MTTVEAKDQGNSLVAVLVVVLILGVLSAIALGGGLANPQPVASATGGHVLTACKSDYDSVNQAVQSYFSANLAYPPPGRAWALAHAKGGPYLDAWPGDPGHYALVWSGQELSVVPSRGTASIESFGHASPASGCYAA